MLSAKGAVIKRTKDGHRPPVREPLSPSWVGRVPQLKLGTYPDGLPFHQVEYLCCKMMLRPNHFVSRESLLEFGDVMRAPAKEHGVGFTNKGYSRQALKIREVLFVDTEDFRLYNNAFILRRRIPYQDGFPIGDPEIVFKFRHPDMQTAAETDVRPQIRGDHRVKFKCQALPLKGMRPSNAPPLAVGPVPPHPGNYCRSHTRNRNRQATDSPFLNAGMNCHPLVAAMRLESFPARIRAE
jgi:hypothetical protein